MKRSKKIKRSITRHEKNGSNTRRDLFTAPPGRAVVLLRLSCAALSVAVRPDERFRQGLGADPVNLTQLNQVTHGKAVCQFRTESYLSVRVSLLGWLGSSCRKQWGCL